MSHRGSKAYHEDAWRKSEYHNGYGDGKSGTPERAANAHYLKGHRDGLRQAKAEAKKIICADVLVN